MPVETEVESAPEVTSSSVETEVSPSGESPPSTETSASRATLETSIESKMANVFKDSADEELVDTPADKTVGEVESEEAAAPGEQQAETPATPAKVNPAAPVIPAAYQRSLKAYGWTDDEIKDSYRADPANFLRTAAKFHENRNEETRRMSELGRLAKQQAPAPVAAPAAVEHTKFDIEGLKKAYGANEPLIKELERANALFDSVNQVMPWVKQSQDRQRQSEMQALGQQIDTFFSGKELEPYAEVYGKDSAKLDEKQMAERQKVLETADLLVRGSRVTGKNLSLTDALTMAHDSVSGPIKTKAVRQGIVAQAKTREAAITLRPGTRSVAPAAKGNRDALVAKAEAGLKSIFR